MSATLLRTIAQSLLERATQYSEWHSAASVLDAATGDWKSEESVYYDAGLVRARLTQLRCAREQGDEEKLVFLLRTALSRNLGDMGHPGLYTELYTGTKALIEEYIAEVKAALQTVLEATTLRDSYKLEALTAARQAFGRTALLLSGGAVLGLSHVGVVKALFERQLLPRVVSGSSAGAIVASVCCIRPDAELPQAIEEFPHTNVSAFGRPEPVTARATRLLQHGVLLDSGGLARVLRDLLGDITFMEAYNKTRRILNVSVSCTSQYAMPRLLNYLTSPHVLVWSAVAASCSLPLIFPPVTLLAKDRGSIRPWVANSRWIDGSVQGDIPIAQLTELFHVNHFIVSQVNPHVAPFLRPHDTRAEVFGFRQTLVDLAIGEIRHLLAVLAHIGVFPSLAVRLQSILGQRYSGDITILPQLHPKHLPVLLTNPTREFLADALLRGERATWPKINIIRNHCAIELALDNAIHDLRKNISTAPSCELDGFDFSRHAKSQPSTPGPFDSEKRFRRWKRRDLYRDRSVPHGLNNLQ